MDAFPPPIIPMEHENIPSKRIQREDPLDFTPYLRDTEEQNVEYLLSLSMILEAKDASFCSRVGREAVACKASLKKSRCWAPFPVPATWVYGVLCFLCRWLTGPE